MSVEPDDPPPVASVPHFNCPFASVSIVSQPTRLAIARLFVRRPPANVEVAVVDVAVRYAKVGLVVETNAPESLMASIPCPNDV